MGMNDWIAGGTALIGAGTSMYLNDKNQKANEKAAKAQNEAQKGLNIQGKALALEQWGDTNFDAQKKEMEKAGLNPGLMYGMSGGGGTTASTGSGGTASKAEVPKPIDIAGHMQIALMKAQKDNIEADTANKKSNVPVNETKATNTTADTETKRLENEWRQSTMEDRKLFEQWKQMRELANKDKDSSDATVGINTIESRISIQNEMQGLPTKQKEEITARIENMAELARQGREKINIEQFAKELASEYPSLLSVTGKGVNEITMWIQKQLAKVIGEENASNYRKVK